MQRPRPLLPVWPLPLAVTLAPGFKPLPAELWDATLDYITDPRTLYNCALVCRTWSHRARHNLLRNVVVDVTKRRRRVAMSMKQFNTLFAEDAQARSFVRSLDIGDVPKVTNAFLGFLDTLELFYGARVHALTLRYCCGTWIPMRLLDTCQRAFSNVASLDLDWAFRNVAEFSEVVAEYKQLRELTLRCLIPRQDVGRVVPPSFARPCAVRLESPTTRCVLADWLALRIPRFGEIWASLEEHTYEILNPIADFHPEVLPRIKSLTFNFDSNFPKAHSTWNDLSARLRLCTQLEELHFVFVGWARPRTTLLNELTTLLTFPQTVRRILIDGEVEGSPEWPEIGELLLAMFPLLEELPSIIQRMQSPDSERVEPGSPSPTRPDLDWESLDDSPEGLTFADFVALPQFPSRKSQPAGLTQLSSRFLRGSPPADWSD